MYELINTSVPNGLIAGTHGFATVAMTKGMPDAIRTRVESFCAYPHRTSAHDQSYFRDNPVNWFHLQIPSGDHVVGRTAPADFDYTGRTNRIAHTLVFGAKEMSIVGGAYILGAESRRFLAEWSGDPKYLTVDKLTAGRLGLADIPKNTTPTNWTATFGDDGAKYARRFAALVAKNVSGGNKCVYFKTSTAWDGDGTRLLGLFADLINLLPEGIRPFVTFSTFAACVPNGVACHLRGVYDKDRAFEIASATQPWVDCEHGRIVHEELLTEESEIAAAVAVAGREVIEGSTGRIPIGAPHGGNSAGNSGRRIEYRVPNPASASDKGFYVKLIIALILFVIVVVGGGYWVVSQQQESQKDADEILKMAREQQARELAEERAEAERSRQDAEKEALRNKQRQEEERKAQIQAEEQLRKEEEERNARKDKEAKEARDKEREKMLADERDRLAKDAVRKAIQREHEKFPTNITRKIQQAWKEDGSLDKCLKDSEKTELTNENSIVAWWYSGSELKHANCHYVVSIRKEAMTGKKRTTYTLSNVVAEGSNWIVYRCFGRTENVVWLWTKKVQGKVFEGGTAKIDLSEKCFGECEEAKKLYAQKIKVIYGLEYRQDANGKEKICVPLDKSELSIDFFKPNKSENEKRKEQMQEELNTLISIQTNECAKLESYKQDVRNVESWYDEFERVTKSPDKESAEQKRGRNIKRDEILRAAYETFKKYGLAVDASRRMAVITKGNDTKNRLITQMESTKKTIEMSVEEAKKAVERKKEDNRREVEGFDKWKDRIKNYVFEIAVEAEEVPSTLLNKKKHVRVDAGE